ncbi:MAG: AbrB/MazE/SpoVT family DNA-binding domain-containing protein [Deltaproteobacteria bacterium]|nr:AbrB/MazE/SpoVT family DNA-binding domain-containing protein [Deltaproteobacteria bacterium]
MPLTPKVSSKGQITLPKKAREALGTDVITIEIGREGQVVLRPVRCLAGALRNFVRQEQKPLSEIRDKAWEEKLRTLRDTVLHYPGPTEPVAE